MCFLNDCHGIPSVEQQHARRVMGVKGRSRYPALGEQVAGPRLAGDRLRAGFEAVRDAVWSALCRNPGITGDRDTAAGW